MLFVRGEVLLRYPNTIVYAAKAVKNQNPTNPKLPALILPADNLDGDRNFHRDPSFHGQLDPDIRFFGFPLVDYRKRWRVTVGFSSCSSTLVNRSLALTWRAGRRWFRSRKLRGAWCWDRQVLGPQLPFQTICLSSRPLQRSKRSLRRRGHAPRVGARRLPTWPTTHCAGPLALRITPRK